eukprot:scaffold8.g1447.t1
MDIMFAILSHFDPLELVAARLVGKAWRELCDVLLEEKFVERFSLASVALQPPTPVHYAAAAPCHFALCHKLKKGETLAMLALRYQARRDGTEWMGCCGARMCGSSSRQGGSRQQSSRRDAGAPPPPHAPPPHTSPAAQTMPSELKRLNMLLSDATLASRDALFVPLARAAEQEAAGKRAAFVHDPASKRRFVVLLDEGEALPGGLRAAPAERSEAAAARAAGVLARACGIGECEARWAGA